MKYLNLVLTLLFLFTLLSCGTTKETVPDSVFNFQFENNEYEIIGLTDSSDREINYLVQYGDNEVLFRAIDSNRNGSLDDLLTGDISLTEANRIYKAGINMAMSQGKHRGESTDREYVVNIDNLNFAIETYPSEETKYRNRFIIYDLEWNLLEMYWDNGSNGTLDEIEQGDGSIENAQIHYNNVLERAAQERHMEDSEEYLIIRRFWS